MKFYKSCLLILLVAVFMFAGCAKEQEEKKPAIRPVRYEQVFMTGGSRIRTFSGITRAGMESKISFKVPGNVISVNVEVGDRIEKGEVIAEIDPKDYKLQMQEAEAALNQAIAVERNAKAQYERVMILWENRNISKRELDGARSGKESSEAARRSIEKRLEQAKLQISYARLTAPVTGLIASVMVEVNENVGAGNPVVTLTSGEKPEVQVTVPEVMISQIKTGSSAIVKFDALPEKTFEATVREVSVASAQFVTTFPVTVRLNQDLDKVRPGMAAEVSFRFETVEAREIILVKPVSVGEDRNGRFVFIVEPSIDGTGIVRRRPVKVGRLTSDGLEISEGIAEGELVVTAGVSKIVDGQRVKLL
ncbi:MAG: efflux RND transporter periplasmic adaptor subunit [Calditrichaeota bacterium]|jgi:membrane fusion protein, multidrug efflux system|nr:efflux RND transporter periplasmic adaptor subunit [Calditrichota bacterium]MBT7616985.1 efflux RND transporter periplasmic adaptor subunit [Calditrichota bacterium]